MFSNKRREKASDLYTKEDLIAAVFEERRRVLHEVANQMPGHIEIYRAIKKSGARSRSDISRAIARIYVIDPEATP